MGLLPFEPRAILIAATFVTFALGILVFVATKAYCHGRSKSPRRQKVGWILMTFAVVLVSSSCILAALVPDVLLWWERIAYILSGLVGLFVCYHGTKIFRMVEPHEHAGKIDVNESPTPHLQRPEHPER